jgi:hypothetical protein
MAIAACGDPDPDRVASDAASISDAADAEEVLACESFCSVQRECDGSTETPEQCRSECVAAPELATDACEEAHRDRNACVGALDCDDFTDWLMPAGGARPCAAEETAIVSACAS